MWYTNTDEGIYIYDENLEILSPHFPSLSFLFSLSMNFLNSHEKIDIKRAICSVYIKLSTDFYMSMVYQAKIGKWFDRKRFDNCRIWTCAGNPMRFLVSRLNHSAKLSVIHHSVHTGPFIRDWYITWSLLHHLTILYRYWKLYDFKNIQYRNSNHREINWPVWEFLLRLVFKILNLQPCSNRKVERLIRSLRRWKGWIFQVF